MFKMTRLEFHFILHQYCTMDEADKQASPVESKVSNLLRSPLVLLPSALLPSAPKNKNLTNKLTNKERKNRIIKTMMTLVGPGARK